MVTSGAFVHTLFTRLWIPDRVDLARHPGTCTDYRPYGLSPSPVLLVLSSWALRSLRTTTHTPLMLGSVTLLSSWQVREARNEALPPLPEVKDTLVEVCRCKVWS
jgi:hypothetical protein